ncbi:hypothetical protein ACUXCC_000383 [Cytobacillus horneckiae]|uniref:hypothetical protein n=1 Tax=Cytobacillus horneckiae TaxID=549687 RepID=UPI0019D2943D|nr:hypothetical protein [Cytobacillus horneckiae]MBN6885248.1 hypothetical protein [Cytobacillus horneckiae]
MEKYLEEIKKIQQTLLSEAISQTKTQELALRLIDISLHLASENSFLRKRIRNADEDAAYLGKMADEWMLKAIEKSETE